MYITVLRAMILMGCAILSAVAAALFTHFELAPVWTIFVALIALGITAVIFAIAVTGRTRPSAAGLPPEPPLPDVHKVLDERVRARREATARRVQLPDRDAPTYSMFDARRAEAFRFSPSGFAILPAYLLDSAYRIVDWNEAFSLAFDRTMDGRVGQSVLEWTYFLDNYEDVLQHGSRAFADPGRLPNVDVEPIVYTSMRYGQFTGTKRAYRMPGDSGATVAWLVTIEPSFVSTDMAMRYKEDLIGLMNLDLMWSEYALSYDQVLLNTTMYRELVKTMAGTDGPLGPIKQGAWILDLGAGTGNVARAIAEQDAGAHIVAIENNRTMLDYLKTKCAQYTAASAQQPGVFAVRQNISSLFGVADHSVDCVILNNVLYSVSDHENVLREVLRVLRPGGELRLSGPHKRSNVDTLFHYLREDLEKHNLFEGMRPAFERVYALNKHRLGHLLNKWSTDELAGILTKLGFGQITHKGEDIYRGESMLIAAQK